ncbi:MAG TPA: hypothetical protein VMX94_06000 [Armatimonadota bacterium]|nr:hypothetical protein [Armatimonadota bacterium]
MRTGHCELCGPPRRTEFVVYLVSKAGRRAERRLCETCARDAERILFGDSGLLLTDLLKVLVTESSVAESEQNRTKVCPVCGNTIEEVEQGGMVGCSMCYTVFRTELDRVIRELHGRSRKPV